MKKIYYPLACCLIGGMLASCGGGAKNKMLRKKVRLLPLHYLIPNH